MTVEVSRRNLLAAGAATAGLAATQAVWAAPASAAPEPATMAAAAARKSAGTALDTVVFGDAASEAAHAVSASDSSVVKGALGLPARVFAPLATPGWYGGSAKATVRVDPVETTYITVKLWGGEVADDPLDNHDWRLQLFAEGKSVGYYDEGAVDNLDLLGVDPRSPGRFFLHTLPLPATATEGKTSLEVEVQSLGRIYSYGGTAEAFFTSQTTPSRAVYRIYSHTEPQFTPAASDEFGSRPLPATRPNTDAATLATLTTAVLNQHSQLIYGGGAYSMDAWGFNELAEAYAWKDSPAYRNPDALTAICAAIDGRYTAWKANSAVLTDSDQQWQGFGRVGLTLAYLWPQLQDELNKDVTAGYTTLINPGFEQGDATPLGWIVQGWASHGTMTRDTAVSHGGGASVKVASDGGSIVVSPSGKTLVGPGSFSVSGWVKTNGSATTPKIDVLFWDASGNLAGTDHNFFVTTGTSDWQQVTGTGAVPAGAVNYEVWMVTGSGDTAWFDDIVFEGPAPASAGPAVPRRVAYTDMLVSSRDYWTQNMRHYTNQAQITAIGIYQANRGLSLLAPAKAWKEPRARAWLYESIGLRPWFGPEKPDGTRTKPLGTDYYVVTPKGLTRELGYVGNYGEVTDWLVMMYESVTRGYQAKTAPEIRSQIVKMVTARGFFRHVDVDAGGYRVARLETVIGWRNEVFPGEIAYAGRTAWDSSPVMAAAVLKDSRLTGWTQEMVADGQFAPQLDLMLTNGSTRVQLNATRMLARDLPAFRAQAPSAKRLPTNWDAADFVFSDETDGAVAVKNGQEVFFASLYWRARQGVNDLGRVHLLTPSSQRSATVREITRGRLSGTTFTVQDWVTWDFAINNSGLPTGIPGGGFTAPGPTVHQALAGETIPLAKIPADAHPALGSTDLGVEEVLVGIAPYYELAYGRYLVAMNTTSSESFFLHSGKSGTAVNLTARTNGTSRKVDLRRPLLVPPRTTVVLYLDA